ncbi:MAG: glutamate--tRNA ligase [Calditrichaeota bacterium]|nr:MAG: glutamate--tRNA ligase [Calditrichota bacterium]MBL1206945.1 glutamate--tRNA ligase [Calditrichota bacterium]NOG46772.1 glutamate--tRNA ligase [Calditrichota bacterium]
MPDVRVRFAPSPTGFVHIGSLRTALYNYLFARKNNGTCVLRIEDTDQARFVEGAIENLFETMDWSGIEFDESIHNKGDLGPYRQSERLTIYKKYVQQLIDEGKAYPCFATAEELEQMREQQIADGQDPKYDGRYRDYPKDKALERMKTESYVIRLRVPQDGETIVNDIVRGEVRFQNEVLDDQVILKSDGYPTYHMANVVDDHLMKISHVIRGEEWLPSTPKHVLLYQFLGWDLPQFAHLPLLLNADRSKLSKRQGDVAVEDYRSKGFLPEALVNFVALLGWSPGDKSDQELFSMDELVNEFSLEHVNKAGAVFDITKLEWMNGYYIRELDESKLVGFLAPFLKEAGVDTSDQIKLLKICQAVQKRIDKATDVKTAAKIFINDTLEIEEQEALEILKEETAKTVLSTFQEKVNGLDSLNSESFKPIMKEIQKEQGIKGPLLWKPVRVALTGVISGPDLPFVIDVFGKEKVISFVNQAISKYV